MSAPQPTRAELLERIRASSKDAVVLAEMQRLGFWPQGEGEPRLAAELIEREAELSQQLNALRHEAAQYADPEQALRRMRRERMAAARAQREATRRQRHEARHERALAWHAERDRHIGWLGEGVSAALKPVARLPADPAPRSAQPSADPPDPSANAEHAAEPAGQARAATADGGGAARASAPRTDRLARHDLPLLADAPALADAMGIGVRELRFLATHREVSRSTHYQRFTVPKKTGGERLISAPMPRLKRAQYWVLDNILAKVPVHAAAHGFLPGHGIVGNARPHADQDVVINLDLRDFFPSVGLPRVKGVFQHLGYGEAVATVLALLCTEARADTLRIDGETVHIAGRARDRVLPQGAPSSPQLTNILCRRLDRRLAALAATLGFAYTRYADDLSFSASGEAADRVGELLRRARWIVRDEGFTPHPTKQAVMRRGRQQTVTGLVVNGAAPGVSRRQRRRLRAALHRAHTQGLAQAHWQQQPVTRAQLIGWAQFVHQVQPAQAGALLSQAQALLPAAHEASAATVNALAQAASARPAGGGRLSFRAAAAQGQTPPLASGRWWQIAPRPTPVRVLTDQERREQRQARRAAQAAAAEPATTAAGVGPAGARPGQGGRRLSDPRTGDAGRAGAPATDGHAPQSRTRRRLGTYVLQLMAAWGLGNVVFHDRLFTQVALVMLVFLYLMRRQSWALWGGTMLLAALVAWSLRFLG